MWLPSPWPTDGRGCHAHLTPSAGVCPVCPVCAQPGCAVPRCGLCGLLGSLPAGWAPLALQSAVRMLTSLFPVCPAQIGGPRGEKGQKGEPAIIEPVSASPHCSPPLPPSRAERTRGSLWGRGRRGQSQERVGAPHPQCLGEPGRGLCAARGPARRSWLWENRGVFAGEGAPGEGPFPLFQAQCGRLHGPHAPSPARATTREPAGGWPEPAGPGIPALTCVWPRVPFLPPGHAHRGPPWP